MRQRDVLRAGSGNQRLDEIQRQTHAQCLGENGRVQRGSSCSLGFVLQVVGGRARVKDDNGRTVGMLVRVGVVVAAACSISLRLQTIT